MTDNTSRFIRTKFGFEGWTEAAEYYLRLVEGAATDEDRERLWELLKTVYGKVGSTPPIQLAEPETGSQTPLRPPPQSGVYSFTDPKRKKIP